MYLESGRWGHLSDDVLHDHRVNDALRIHEKAEALEIGFAAEIIDDRAARVSIQVHGFLDNFEFNDEHDLLIQTSNMVCLTCTRRAGNYFEATVQLRSSGRKLSEDELNAVRVSLDEMMAEMEPDPMFFITKEGTVVGGWDVTMGSKALARSWGRHMVNRWGGHIKETNTIVGQKDGVDVSRLTLLYRKPGYDVGDVIRFREKHWLVQSWQKDGPLLLALDYKEKTGASWRDLEKTVVACRWVEQTEVDVLNRDASVAEFMDPNDFRMRSVRLPHDDDGKQSRLRVGWVIDEWVAIPRVRNPDEVSGS